jgi:hypothetical protein
MKFRYFWPLLAVVFLLTGCGKEEKREATELCNFLQQRQADFAAANAQEKDLFGSTRAWAESIIAQGSGHGRGLEENAASADALANSASAVSGQLSQLRQALSDLQLHKEYPQTVRGNLENQIMQRMKKLQEVRTNLTSSAANFREFAQSRAYKGDSYPGGIDKLNSILGSYSAADEVLAKAVTDLKEKYKI